ncbi:hypothetical protein CO115_04175 [Candidatus Falkowbacteria bacterium CG_4_9_14_3_um_filter_36_9]|nr:MAG: hypothetical protein CO115_04175 [Candidatus Falkowbacteria bacterium CG_4_9_14_3_um_filter_36_9]
MKISLSTARRIALNAQLLDGRTKLADGKIGVEQIISHLGYIQIDTIQAVRRAHHQSLWSRMPSYDSEMLNTLIKETCVFEYWGHALSYLPISDYRYYLPRMKEFADPYSKWEKERFEKYGCYMQPVLERIRKEGPLMSKDFVIKKLPKGTTRRERNPYKPALEMLFWRGEIMVKERRKFQRVYDLTERVLPDHTNTTFPTEEEYGRFLIKRALQSYGIASEKEIRNHLYLGNKELIAKTLKKMLESGQVVSVTIENNKDAYCALNANLEPLTKLKKIKPCLHMLSPFDNMVIQRERTLNLFNFDYNLECYVPPAKRKWGYWVMPVLWGEKFIGRFDPKVDRKKKMLNIVSLYFEDDFNKQSEVIPHLANKFGELAKFNHCESINIIKTFPSNVKKNLQSELKKIIL